MLYCFSILLIIVLTFLAIVSIAISPDRTSNKKIIVSICILLFATASALTAIVFWQLSEAFG